MSRMCEGWPVPPVDEWPQRPILLTKEEEGCYAKNQKVLRANGEVHSIHSDIFEGRARFFVRNSASEERENQDQSIHDEVLSHENYFRNRKRKAGVLLTGRFKERVCCADLVVGTEFDFHFVETGKPQRVVIALVMYLLRKFAPHLTLSLGDKPKLFAPVVLDCKTLSVINTTENSKENDGLNLHSMEENTSVLGGWFASQRRSARQRKAFFSKASNRRQFYFETGHEYSFEFYQHTLSFETYLLNAGPIQIDVGRITKGQPFQFCMRTKSACLCKFNFWSERLLAHWPATHKNEEKDEREVQVLTKEPGEDLGLEREIRFQTEK